METKKYLFRFERYSSNLQGGDYLNYVLSYTSKCKIIAFEIIKETKKGFWINVNNKKKFVHKEGKRIYARENKFEAFNDFKFRTQRSVRILKARLAQAKSFLSIDFKDEHEIFPKHLK